MYTNMKVLPEERERVNWFWLRPEDWIIGQTSQWQECLPGNLEVYWTQFPVESPNVLCSLRRKDDTLPSVTFMGCTCTYMHKLRNTLKTLGTLTATVYKLAPSGLQERYKML